MSNNNTPKVFELKKQLFALKVKLCIDENFKQEYHNITKKIKREIAKIRSTKI